MRVRLLLGLAGAMVLGYGIVGLVSHSGATVPAHTAVWLVGGVLAHDLVLAPLVAVTGWLLTRLLPAWVRPTVQGGLVVAGVVVLVALPAVLRQDASSDNSSLLPLDYRANLVRVLLVVATVTALLVALRALRRGRDGARPPAIRSR